MSLDVLKELRRSALMKPLTSRRVSKIAQPEAIGTPPHSHHSDMRGMALDHEEVFEEPWPWKLALGEREHRIHCRPQHFEADSTREFDVRPDVTARRDAVQVVSPEAIQIAPVCKRGERAL